MTVIQNDLDQEWNREGQLVSQTPVARDITGRAVANNIRTKGLAALQANRTFLQGAPALNTQIQALSNQSIAAILTQLLAQSVKSTRQNSAFIRLLLGGGLNHLAPDASLLDDTATDT